MQNYDCELYAALFLCLLVLSADNFCKKFWQEVGPDLDPYCLTIWWYSWKTLFCKSSFWKKVNSMQNYPVGKELKVTAVNEIDTFMWIISWMCWNANVKPCLPEHKREHIICCLLALTLILLIFLFQKIFSALTNVLMHSRLILSWKQTLWTLIRLLLRG